MRKAIIAILIIFSLFSCQPYVWNPHYITFDEAIEFITSDYGEPTIVKNIRFYDDGTVRNRLIGWDIDPPEFAYIDEYGRERYYLSISAEAWYQPDPSREVYYRYHLYGWEVLRWFKGNASYID